MTEPLVFHPLTPARWPELERLFGPNGATSGCWCMFWRQTGPEFHAATGADRKKSFKAVCTRSATPPGVVAYRGDQPVGWVAIAPRADYKRFDNARVLVPIDDQPVWSITCFFIHRTARRQGLMEKLIAAAVDFAREEGATIVEAYPRPTAGKVASATLYVGTTNCFERAGFKVVARPSDKRAVVRKKIRKPRAKRARS
jgi:GNAT superfamily N-acetyltransferase